MNIAVVGGGLIGLACAAEVAARGHAVTVFDAAPEAREASWAAAGMLAPHHECDHDGPLYRFACAGLAAYPAFCADHGIEASTIDLRQDGSWIPLLDDDDEREAATRCAFLRSRGVPVTRVEGAELRAAEPALAGDVRAALQVPGGQVNPRLFTDRLRERCRDLGVTMRYRCRVDQLTADGLEADGAHHQATVVLASGAWTPALATASGIVLAGEPVKGQLLRFGCDDTLLHAFIHCRHAYLVPRRGDGLVVGATMVWDGFDKTEDTDAIARLAANARRLLPTLRDAPIIETWTGLRPRLHAGLPCLTQVRPGLIIATGHFRNGILLAPLTARCVAALVAGTMAEVDLSAFGLPG